MKHITILFVLFIPMFSFGQVVKSYKKQNDKVVIILDKGELYLSPLTENTVRIQYGLDMRSNLPELVFTSKVKTPDFKVSESNTLLEITINNYNKIILNLI